MAKASSFTLPADVSPKIRELFDYWQSIHPESGLPGRRNLDPVDIPQLLPNIWMIDVRQDPLRFHFRLVGTEIVKFTGRDVTGLSLSEVYPDYENTDAFRFHRACALGGQPAYRKSGLLSNVGYDHVEAERLYLPLAEDGTTVDILLVMTVFQGAPPRRK